MTIHFHEAQVFMKQETDPQLCPHFDSPAFLTITAMDLLTVLKS